MSGLETPNKNKFLCVHGHFYQPPRENPWTEEVDPEESALPYRDWNSRIAQECYGPNAAGPVLGADGRIAALADNYRRMSFNFGATLLNWLEARQPDLYRAILEADAASVKERGHGNALAQPYIHAILPLQTLRDKRTLVRWGLDDFHRRFGRPAEGMWLPETAVDEETLEVLAEAGVRFTILSPRQASRVRHIGGDDFSWRDVSEETLQPTRPYRWVSKSQPGLSLAVFFFHQGLHESVVSGEAFAAADTLYLKIFGRTLPDDSTQLISIATDGELYGHHHRKGAAALSQTFFLAEEAGMAVVNYAQFLDAFPPPQEVEIRADSSWSCEHGLGRWKENCGCRSAARASWSQHWRGPLRDALNWLSREVDGIYERKAGEFFQDFWRARELYSQRLADFSPEAALRFLGREALRELSDAETRQALELLEMQRHRLAMFTSCGWFFDDVSGIEAVQCLSRAGRAIELAARFGADLAEPFKMQLSMAASNVPALEHGGRVYERLVEPQRVGLRRAAAQWALLEHLQAGLGAAPQGWGVEAETVARRSKQGLAGRDRSLSISRVAVTRLSTLERMSVTTVVHQRDRLDFACRLGPPAFEAPGLLPAFEGGDEDFERFLNEALSAEFWTLEALFAEERAEALRWLTPDLLGGPSRRAYLDRWVAAMGELRAGTGADACLDLMAQAKTYRLTPDRLPWIRVARSRLSRMLESLLIAPDAAALSRVGRWLEAFEAGGPHVDLWEMRHLFWRWRAKILSGEAAPAERALAVAFGEKLGFSDSALALGALA